jgi:hypothetical protein
MAESAVRAGLDIVTVDHFGDLDQKRMCENVSLRERGLRYSAAAILEVARTLAYDAVAYGGGLENHPDAVTALAAGRTLLGNRPATLRRVREPATVLPFLAARGFAVPRTVARQEALPRAGAWLRKPARGGGGQGIDLWDGQPLAAGEILQGYVEGVSASAAFVADGRQSVVLGWTEQLRGPRGFLYGGNILPLEGPPAAFDEVCAIARALTEEFGLCGLNGFDFILSGGTPVVVEVNPRFCASMELIDRATGLSAFALHLAAFRGSLPTAVRGGDEQWGKAVLYAPTRVILGDTTAWMERGVRDVPHPGEVIQKGHPICTVLASGSPRAVCEARLRAEMAAILTECASRAGRGLA